MNTDLQKIIDLLFLLFALFIEVACLAFFIVLFCLTWRQFRNTWRRALFTGIITTALALPGVIAGVYYLDIHKASPDVKENMYPFVRVFLACIAVGVLVLMMPLRALYYHVAAYQWGAIRRAPAPTLAGPPGTRLVSTLAGIGVGLVTLILTLVVFYYGHVGERKGDSSLSEMFPGFMGMPRIALAVVIVSFGSLYAIVEELIFRGGILGFLIRITGNKPGLAWLFITLVALLWAVLHYPNTDSPAIKIGQIFFMGLALGGMTRRWGLAPAIWAHVTLNAGAGILAALTNIDS